MIHRKKALFVFAICIAIALACSQMCFAAVSVEEAEMLKTTLTPFGAERAGNKEGTIPAWDGGYTKVPPGYKSGEVRPDPFKGEKKLFSINAQNMSQYADKLADGVKYLMNKYPDFRIDVYPTHRTAAFPQYVYDAAYKNALNAKVLADGYSIEGAYNAIPFPIPKSGTEAIFNHLLAFQGVSSDILFRNYVVTSKGKPTMVVEARNNYQYPYYYQHVPYEEFDGRYYLFRQIQTAPPFKAGESILWWDPVNMYKEGGRKAWQYLTGQRRVRRAPAIAYDTPDFVSSGQNYFDEIWMFNGAIDRYDWKLVGKQEMFIPYNCNDYYAHKDLEVIGNGVQYINPDHVRWELHRVWVVEANLAEGKRHVIAKRRMYMDEDSWYIILYDGWDGKGNLWRYSQAIPINIVELPATVPITFGVHNLETGARTVTNQVNEMDFQLKVYPVRDESLWEPDNLAGTGIR
jgi:hypothetical protein